MKKELVLPVCFITLGIFIIMISFTIKSIELLGVGEINTFFGIAWAWYESNKAIKAEVESIKELDHNLFNKIKHAFEGYFQGFDFDEWGGTYAPDSGESAILLSSLCIHKLELEGKKLIIYSSRPGILIGKGGRNIELFREYLKSTVDSEIEIYVKEFNPFKQVHNFN